MREYLYELQRQQQEAEERRERALFLPKVFLATIVIEAIMLIAWMAAPALADSSDDPTGTDCWIYCQPDSYVNIRSGPSKDCREEGRLFLGDHIFVTERHGNWVHAVNLSCEMGEGWVSASYVNEWEPCLYPAETKAVTVKGAVNARTCIEGSRRAKLKKGDTVIIYADGEQWAVTDAGIIQSSLLSVLPPEPSPEPLDEDYIGVYVPPILTYEPDPE